MAHAVNALFQIVDTRFDNCCEAKGLVLEEQSGFCLRHSTLAVIFVVIRLQNLDGGLPYRCACHLTIPKRYTTVSIAPFSKSTLARFRVPPHMIAVFCYFYDMMTNCVRSDSGNCSEKFNVEQGLRQGCVVSPLSFKVFATILLVALE